jgi:hypothetical protein
MAGKALLLDVIVRVFPRRLVAGVVPGAPTFRMISLINFRVSGVGSLL